MGVQVVVWVICECGEKHKLFPGIVAPLYWCGDELKKLVPDDEVEYEDRGSPEGYLALD